MDTPNQQRTVLLINPKAGIKGVNTLRRNFSRFSNEFDYSSFSDIEKFRDFIRTNINNYDTFIAVGGDGTVNSLVSELVGTKKVIGVLPYGSGNGFAREMGFRKNLNILLKNIRKNEYINTDVLIINDRTCINVAGTGFDSYVAHNFNNLRRRGFWNYVITAIKIAFMIKPFPVTIKTNKETIEEKVYMVSVANTRQFGNNALIAPMAIPNDGKFNIAIVKPFAKVLIPFFAIKMLTGTLRESRYLKYLESENPISINSRENKYHIDGEPVVINDPIKIHIIKDAVKILRTSRNRWI
jgi:diacylglycerol kinase (ATP)